MKVAVIGDRNWQHVEPVFHELIELPRFSVIHLADEPDSKLNDMVTMVASECKRAYRTTIYPADHLLELGVELVLVFHDFIQGSKRSKVLVDQARARNLAVRVVSSRDYKVRPPRTHHSTMDEDIRILFGLDVEDGDGA